MSPIIFKKSPPPPSGQIGLYADATHVSFDYVYIWPDQVRNDLAGRWINLGFNNIDSSTQRLRLSPSNSTLYSSVLLKGVRMDRFQATFTVVRESTPGSPGKLRFVFNAADQDDYDCLVISHSSTVIAPAAYQVVDGVEPASAVLGSVPNNMITRTNASDPLYMKIICDPASSPKLSVYASPDNANWTLVYTTSNLDSFTSGGGGLLGFAAGPANGTYVDDLEIKSWTGSAYDQTEHLDSFSLTSGASAQNPTHDAAGNLTFDGVFAYTYDAWNRLVEIKRAYYNGGVQTGSTISTIAYDGMNRRIEKSVTNSADLNGTYDYYYKGQSIVEVRDDSDDVLKQYVWGQNYIDELVQIGINTNPGSDDDGGTAGTQDYCDDFYYTMHDANFNVLGVVDDEGTLIERYEYTPYGERQVFISAGNNDLNCSAPTLMSQRLTSGGGLCEVGHQGLFHDDESGLINNRARILHPSLGRFLQRDPLGYVDRMSLYQYVRSNSLQHTDSYGTDAGYAASQAGEWAKGQMRNMPMYPAGVFPYTPPLKEWAFENDESDIEKWPTWSANQPSELNYPEPDPDEIRRKPCPEGKVRILFIKKSTNEGRFPGYVPRAAGVVGRDVEVSTSCVKCEGCCNDGPVGEAGKLGIVTTTTYATGWGGKGEDYVTIQDSCKCIYD